MDGRQTCTPKYIRTHVLGDGRPPLCIVDFGHLLAFQQTGLIVEVPGVYVHYQARQLQAPFPPSLEA